MTATTKLGFKDLVQDLVPELYLRLRLAKSLLAMKYGNIPPLIDWISYAITNWTYPDPDPFVSHAKIQGAIVLRKKAENVCGNKVRRVGLP